MINNLTAARSNWRKLTPAEAVGQGWEFLGLHYPGFQQRVNPETVNVEDVQFGITGQLLPGVSFMRALYLIGQKAGIPLEWDEGEQLGLCTRKAQDYPLLQKEWVTRLQIWRWLHARWGCEGPRRAFDATLAAARGGTQNLWRIAEEAMAG